ncbi:MAG: hypothetical protein ABH879_01545 [archaeon]
MAGLEESLAKEDGERLFLESLINQFQAATRLVAEADSNIQQLRSVHSSFALGRIIENFYAFTRTNMSADDIAASRQRYWSFVDMTHIKLRYSTRGNYRQESLPLKGAKLCFDLTDSRHADRLAKIAQSMGARVSTDRASGYEHIDDLGTMEYYVLLGFAASPYLPAHTTTLIRDSANLYRRPDVRSSATVEQRFEPVPAKSIGFRGIEIDGLTWAPDDDMVEFAVGQLNSMRYDMFDNVRTPTGYRNYRWQVSKRAQKLVKVASLS